ncbi:zinc finger CCCH domain-containing protein 30 [Selaginella moellendorffii]|uniref:zinc finger CCCH domain-containing protein 30 n=1 Tax=Selaginella moellendorffii TaxID=88036 RepID=UPI000D1CBB8B|nr:zinc finger CCCH domain-containing protein 30 [Selaginella moellendorffii]XP_024531812.1 zinc finger CCCH domain-containing protein 30 [Selaginella moellendorffii]XP_024531813.1 zinc finger CCCH domain-containing protein 30 [Selaginella moellendorffii]XP_024540335.1 zinc finger CCCH domain-containing protein 30 [Selaginella moellendorffii]XP_024540340.1 zinc finger CCCH domain-containing protein 30 [Selaginella moellendorffii]|eukprot:XP_024531811.1 zinc finger CCCH domain-containing protein 30 [Selaginella moellendorffii]
MCGGPEHSKPVAKNYRMMLADDVLGRSPLSQHPEALLKPPLLWSDMDKGCKERETTPSLLELAANNDLETFRRVVEEGGMDLDEPDSWYLRKIGSTKMATEKRSPLMIAALYGSIDVLSYILKSGKVDVNKFCGEDEVTALHCAAAGGSSRGVDAVKLLLSGGANSSLMDAYGRRPAQVIAVPLKLRSTKSELEKMLSATGTARHSLDTDCKGAHQSNGGGAFSSSKLDDDSFADTREGFVSMSSMSSVCSSPDSYSPVFSPQFPSSPKSAENPSDEKTKDYPVDPSLPDIKNSIYTTDEFRMFSFKVRPCSRAYSHDWTECPFVHPGENARRRDPRRFHYSCVPCPDFRKGACRRGDTCEYAHGVFECWLHPAQYRTRLCKDGTSCSRRVCFFAHTSEEMRPLFVSMGSAVPSPRASSPLDAGSVSPPLSSTSQSPVIMVPPFSPSNASGSGLSTPPLSPSGGGSWSQPTVPTLHLPGGAGLQASRLRAALSARDIPVEGADYDGHLAPELSSMSRQSSLLSSSARMHKFGNLGLSIPSTSLQDLFSAEVSPLSAVHQSQLTPQEHSLLSQQLHSQLQLQQLLSPLSTMSQLQSHVSPQFQSPVQSIFSAGSPCSMARRCSDGTDLSTSTAAEVLAAGRKASAFAQRDRGSWSMKEVSGSSLPSASWSDWGSPTGKPDWGIQGQDLGKFRKSASFATHGGPEPDLSWVQTLVKDGPVETTSSSSTDEFYASWPKTEQQQQQQQQ